MVDLEQEVKDDLIGTVNLDIIFNKKRSIREQTDYLIFLHRFYETLRTEHSEENGNITLNYALNEWIRRGYHLRFKIFYSSFGDAEVIYQEIIGRHNGA